MKSCRGHGLVEFALAAPIAFSLLFSVFQVIRLAVAQLRIESIAVGLARRLSLEPPGADLAALGRAIIARENPPLAFSVRLRRLAIVPAAYPRRSRLVDVLEIDLASDGGPRVWPGLAPARLRAHGREMRWGAT